jgi:hypothetical protein
MNVYDILKLILDTPSNPKAYEKLAEYYEYRSNHNEALAIRKLIEKRFYKNGRSNSSNSGEE